MNTFALKNVKLYDYVCKQIDSLMLTKVLQSAHIVWLHWNIAKNIIENNAVFVEILI